MSYDKITVALSQRLESLTPAVPIVWPNEEVPQNPSTPFLKVNFLPGMTENPAIVGAGAEMRRYVGLMQVSACFAVNSGEGPARRKADDIAAWFPVGSSLSYDGVTVHVTRTPAVAQGLHDGAWYVVPVSIFYRADVF